MRIINKILIILLFIYLFECAYICPAQEHLLFQGEVNTDNINIRSDSTINSEVICKVNKGDRVELIQELYDWYKIKLPKSTPAFIKKDLVIPLDDKTARVAKDRVNIRLKANESSLIIGRINQGELINILKDEQQWYRIESVNNSFGWINKKFVNPAPARSSGVNNVPPIMKKEDTKKDIN